MISSRKQPSLRNWLRTIRAVRAADANTTAVLTTHDVGGVQRFHRLFVCSSTSTEAFNHCRPLLCVDGTFTKEIFSLTVLLAESVDADNHAVMIAWAIVEGESESSWRRYADADNASVHTCSGKWYQVDLLRRTCSCGCFQYHDILCGHAVAVIQRFRPLAPSPQRSPRDYIPYNLTVAAMVATYSQSLPPIDVGALQAPTGVPALWECRPPLFKKAKGRPQTARLTAGEQRG